MKLRLALITGLLLLQACAATSTSRNAFRLEHSVRAVAETEPVKSSDDAADDPAIWINPDNPAASLIVATDKQSGLYVYDLDGSERQYLKLGFTNNVDLRTAPWGNGDTTLVATGRRFPSELLLLALDHETRELRLVKRHAVDLREPYGICMYLDQGRQPNVFLNSTDGWVAQYAVTVDLEISELRRFRLKTKVEGCVVDDEDGMLYIGEEDRGIWRTSANAESRLDLDMVDSIYNKPLAADVEGLALYHGPRKLLIASSQGNNSFAVYDTQTLEFIASFYVTAGEKVDGATDTDGLEVTAVSLPGYPHGVLVVQDGYNTDPVENQNFKIVSWSDVQRIIDGE